MRTIIHAASLIAAAALHFAPPARAFEIVGSLGVDDLRSDRDTAAALEARTGDLARWRGIAFRLGAAIAADSDLWTGAGPVLIVPLADLWRLEASVMLGVHAEHGGNDLGTDFPIFRSLVGVSYAVADDWWLGVSLDHKSNARTANANPGVETLLVNLARTF